ncbi:hypothetical protein GCM10010094_57820 [Streptomyces flaveus]|uniref:Uncharacterized protein n=1 Tax=Streptomyces flaveus TaxID=66370 RepID=A0A917R3Y1_9ACTN|nr:hypothetical protein GCM10010094_57820 [Streptomyces flaveus]
MPTTGSTSRTTRPPVTRVLGVEPEPHLRSFARAAAGQAPVPVEVVDGLAERTQRSGNLRTSTRPSIPDDLRAEPNVRPLPTVLGRCMASDVHADARFLALAVRVD